MVTSDDDEIINVSKIWGYRILKASEAALDDVPFEPVIQHALIEHEKITKTNSILLFTFSQLISLDQKM